MVKSRCNFVTSGLQILFFNIVPLTSYTNNTISYLYDKPFFLLLPHRFIFSPLFLRDNVAGCFGGEVWSQFSCCTAHLYDYTYSYHTQQNIISSTLSCHVITLLIIKHFDGNAMSSALYFLYHFPFFIFWLISVFFQMLQLLQHFFTFYLQNETNNNVNIT